MRTSAFRCAARNMFKSVNVLRLGLMLLALMALASQSASAAVPGPPQNPFNVTKWSGIIRYIVLDQETDNPFTGLTTANDVDDATEIFDFTDKTLIGGQSTGDEFFRNPTTLCQHTDTWDTTY